ncbi:MAG: steroid-24-oyl-CoA synthetase [Frankiales bacterium]|jgi:acyl-CoA synthetase (AMP-forming)/AMP-acid ligase II|nr:steroid-24-oyl-CoA synthetase [Frankiales bacterium]
MSGVAIEPDLVEEEVLGERMLVFRNRLPSLRAVLDASAAYADRDYLVEGDRRLTYAGHHAAAASIARFLQEQHDVTNGSRVAILGGNCLEWVATFWAVVGIGGVAVALSSWWSGPELAQGLADAEPALLVADEESLAKLTARPSCPVLLMERDIRPLLDAPDGLQLPPANISEDEPAVILFTSGTTGRAKGAVHTHRNIVGLVQIQKYISDSRVPPGITMPPGRVFTTSPLFHVSGLHSGVVANLAQGWTTVWQLGRFDPVAVMATIEREKCTSWSTVPTAIWRVINHPERSRFDLSSLFHIGGGGAAFSPSLQTQMRESIGAQLSSGLGYGLTEGTSLATVASNDDLRAHPTTSGRPVPTVQIEIRDESGVPLPDSEEGEICLRGPLVMLGYWRNKDATDAIIGPCRWLRTGDIGYLQDGLLFLSTRRYDLILRGGENVYPVEIENCLEGHPAVEECVVLGLPHDELGQEVTAVVVPKPDAVLDIDELTRYVRERLAYFKVPSRWILRTTELPRTASGKVVRPEVMAELTG